MQEIRMQEKRDEDIAKVTHGAKKTGVYVIVISICLILLILIAVLVFTLIPYLKQPTRTEVSVSGGGGDSKTISFYECLMDDCSEILTLPDGRKLVYDGNYVLLNDADSTSFTTAMTGKYASITSFTWGDKDYIYAVLDSGNGSIFSIVDNKYITGDNYSQIFTDINDDIYKNQTWVESKYIIAMRAGDYRMVDISNGHEKVQGKQAVFATTNSFFIAYDEDGKRRIFNDSNIQLAIVESGSIFYRGEVVIVVDGDGNLEAYDHDGKTSNDIDFIEELSSMQLNERLDALQNNSAFGKVPN